MLPAVHKIGESTSHVRFNAKTNGLQITQEKQGGNQIVKFVKNTSFFFLQGIFLEQKLLLTKS